MNNDPMKYKRFVELTRVFQKSQKFLKDKTEDPLSVGHVAAQAKLADATIKDYHGVNSDPMLLLIHLAPR